MRQEMEHFIQEIISTLAVSHCSEFELLQNVGHYPPFMSTFYLYLTPEEGEHIANNQCALMTFQGQESWMKATRMALYG